MVENLIREVYYFKKDVQRQVHCKIFEQNLSKREKGQETQIMGGAL